MSELRFELPSTEPVVHGDAAFGRSPKNTGYTGSVIRVFEWVHTTYGDTKGLRGSWLHHSSKVSITTLLAISALHTGPAEHTASVVGTPETTLCRKTDRVSETAPRV